MAKSFPARVRSAMQAHGFTRHGNGMLVRGAEVACFVSGSLFRQSVHLTFGLWLSPLSDQEPPDRVELFHIYGAADVLCGLSTRLPTKAYMKSDEEFLAEQDLAITFAEPIADCLREMISLDNVVSMFAKKRFGRCLVRWEARDLLEAAAMARRRS